jgi:hypothetical protein
MIFITTVKRYAVLALGDSSFDVFNFRLDRFINEQGFSQHYNTVASKVEKAV